MAINDTRSNYTPPRAATRMNALDWIATILMVVGGINWGLIGLFNIDLVASLFGQMTVVSRAIYLLVGLAALYGIVLAIRQSSTDRQVLACPT